MSDGASPRDPDVPIPFDACDLSGRFVFVSYAHDDKALVYPELARIRSFGIRVWYDEGIEPGSEWPQAIATALNRAAALVVMITPSAVASRNVRNEINAAVRWGKPVFAVHLAQTELPLGLELQVGAVQAVMRWRMDEGSYARKLGEGLASYGEAGNETSPAGPPAPAVPHAADPATAPGSTPVPVPEDRLTPVITQLPPEPARQPPQVSPILALGEGKDLVLEVAFSPDGRLLACVGGRVRLWDPATGKLRRTLTDYVRPLSATGVAFSPDGRMLATASDDKRVRLWDLATGRRRRTLTGHGNYVNTVAYSPDGRLLASGSHDQTVRLWDPATGRHLRTLTGHTETIYAVAFSPDGRLLASGSHDGTVRLWDPATGRHLRTLTGRKDKDSVSSVTAVAFRPDGRLLASSYSYDTDDPVRLWDPATGEHLRTLTGHTDSVEAVAFSPDGRLLASGSHDGTVRLWDPVTGEHLRIASEILVSTVAFSPDGRLLASGSARTVRLWLLTPAAR